MIWFRETTAVYSTFSYFPNTLVFQVLGDETMFRWDKTKLFVFGDIKKK